MGGSKTDLALSLSSVLVRGGPKSCSQTPDNTERFAQSRISRAMPKSQSASRTASACRSNAGPTPPNSFSARDTSICEESKLKQFSMHRLLEPMQIGLHLAAEKLMDRVLRRGGNGSSGITTFAPRTRKLPGAE
jgi:hypothetical protein